MQDLIHKHFNLYPDRAARIIESCDPKLSLEILQIYPVNTAEILRCLSPVTMLQLLDHDESNSLLSILRALNVNILATLLKPLHKAKQKVILSALPSEKRTTIEELIQYDMTEVGYFVEDYGVVLNEKASVAMALMTIENMQTSLPIFIVSVQGQYLGTLDYAKLIKYRSDENKEIQSLVSTSGFSVKASTPLKNIINHTAWAKNEMIPVVGKTNCLLGVVSKNKIKYHASRLKSPQIQEIPSDKLIKVYDSMWGGLQKFWENIR